MSSIYLDFNGTTPIDPLVAQEMMPFITECFGNPSSSHEYGKRALEAVVKARNQVKTCLGAADASEIVFVSGGTESINYALRGASATAFEKHKKNHLITSCVEHVAVLETCKYLEKKGFTVTYVPVDRSGRVCAQDITNAITSETFLVSIMHSNNEIGTLQPIRDICQAVKAIDPSILVHTDASQSIGKVAVDVQTLGVDYLTLAGHKCYAPKGIGALYVKSGTPSLEKLIHGAGQENGQRAGTENVLLTVALGKACELVTQSLPQATQQLERLKYELLKGIKKHCQVDYIVNGGTAPVLPNTLSISFKSVLASEILEDLQGAVAASAGAACHSSGVSMSHVLRAIRVPVDYAAGTIRLSVGRSTTLDQVTTAAEYIAGSVNIAGARFMMKRRMLEHERGSVIGPTKRLYYNSTYEAKWGGLVLAIRDDLPCPVKDTQDKKIVAVIMDQTIFHPQGGGQPADTGEIVSALDERAKFTVLDVRTNEDRTIVHHFGYFASEATSFPIKTPGIMHIDLEKRSLHARLHSAGHLIDKAMANLGYSMPAAKAYHFLDSPFVEYIGKLQPEDKETLVKRLNEECAALIMKDIPTESEELMKPQVADVCDSDVSHLSDDSPIRLVSVAGMYCPCGGTHVEKTKEIGTIHVTKVRSKGGRVKISYELPLGDPSE